MTFRKTIPLAAALALFACATETAPLEEPTNVVTMVDEGEMCMFADEPLFPGLGIADDELLSFTVGNKLYITVMMPGCLSESCDVERQADCTITRDGDALHVSSHLSYRVEEAAACTLDCARLVARCESEALPEGNYTVFFGGERYSLPVPSTLTDNCN